MNWDHHRKLTTGALPLRPRDLTLLRQDGCRMGRRTPPRPFRPLSRRSGRIPALPYPPLSLGPRILALSSDH
jgi:hypothetical protein